MDSLELENAQLFDASGVIGIDHHCRRCGYNLRGLREEGICPECGSPVGFSIRGNFLRFADPIWVDKLAQGLKIILWMLLFKVLVRTASPAIGDSLTAVLGLVVEVISFYGVWLLTEPEPCAAIEYNNITARKFIRIASIIGIAGSLLGLTPEMLGRTSGLVVLVVGFVMGLVGLAGEFAKFTFCKQLAERIPDTDLALRAGFLRWAYVMSEAITYVFGTIATVLFFMSMFAASAGGQGVIAFSCIMGIGAIGMLVFGIMTIFMLLRLRKALAEQAKFARQSWATV